MNKKSKQLGINFSTASARLRKMLLFALLKELNKNICYRCNLKIDSYEDLSIDHKINWLDNDTNLFWDLNNIAFSHKKCNRPQRIKNRYTAAPDGTSWCFSCKKYVSISRFGKKRLNSRKKPNSRKYQACCYDCRKLRYGW